MTNGPGKHLQSILPAIAKCAFFSSAMETSPKQNMFRNNS
jgi:hypothetical protein